MARPSHFNDPEVLLAAFNIYKADCEKEEIPLTVSGFCNSIDSYRDMLSEYAKKPEFSSTIKKIYSLIENNIEVGLLQNKYNSAGAIFNLKNNFGWKDKTETELTGKDGSPLSITLDNKQSSV